MLLVVKRTWEGNPYALPCRWVSRHHNSRVHDQILLLNVSSLFSGLRTGIFRLWMYMSFLCSLLYFLWKMQHPIYSSCCGVSVVKRVHKLIILLVDVRFQMVRVCGRYGVEILLFWANRYLHAWDQLQEKLNGWPCWHVTFSSPRACCAWCEGRADVQSCASQTALTRATFAWRLESLSWIRFPFISLQPDR